MSIGAGEQRELSLALQAKEQTSAEMDPGSGTPTVVAAASGGGGWKATAGWVTLGVGGASLITGVIFGVMVSSKSDEHAQAIDDGKTYGELQEIADAGRRFEKAQIATLVLGGVALAAGGGLLLWHYLGGSRSTESRAAFIAPLLSKDARGLVGGLRF